jgi:ribonuclease HI
VSPREAARDLTRPIVKLPLLAIYADESCLGNGREGSNPGGAAGLIEYRGNHESLARFDFWLSEPATTNNRMALRGAIEAFRVISRKGKSFRAVYTSDSQYLVKGMSEWIYGWIVNGWRRKGGTIENLELWRTLTDAVRGHQTQWRWVRGHRGHPQNEYADHLAVRAARAQTHSEGAVPSGFDTWLEAERAKGRKMGEPDPFPDERTFKAARPLPQVTKASSAS